MHVKPPLPETAMSLGILSPSSTTPLSLFWLGGPPLVGRPYHPFIPCGLPRAKPNSDHADLTTDEVFVLCLLFVHPSRLRESSLQQGRTNFLYCRSKSFWGEQSLPLFALWSPNVCCGSSDSPVVGC